MPVERHFHQHTDHILYHKPEKMKGLWLIEERRDLHASISASGIEPAGSSCAAFFNWPLRILDIAADQENHAAIRPVITPERLSRNAGEIPFSNLFFHRLPPQPLQLPLPPAH